jgi:hypothetical protein
MFATEPSEGMERDEVSEAKLSTCDLVLPDAKSGGGEGSMGGTLGEKRETCGVVVVVVLELPPSAGVKDHGSS